MADHVLLVEVEQTKHTEASVLKLLRERHAAKQGGNGPEWAYMEKVRNAAGFNATRTADAMALGLWPSRGHELHGFEVKVSRSDWKKELDDAAKAEAWTGVVDRWWVVCPGGIVKRDELPVSWGLMEVNAAGNRLTVKVQAPALTTVRHDTKRSILVCLLRAAGAGLKVTPEKALLDATLQEGIERGKERQAAEVERLTKQVADARTEREHYEAAVRAIEDVLGVSFDRWRMDSDPKRVKEISSALQAVLSSDAEVHRAQTSMKTAAAELDRAAAWIRRQLPST